MDSAGCVVHEPRIENSKSNEQIDILGESEFHDIGTRRHGQQQYRSIVRKVRVWFLLHRVTDNSQITNRFIQSKLFTFVIGKEKREFKIHAEAITSISQPLCKLIENGMLESVQEKVTWEDVEVADFARFAEYAYRYDYTSPSWVLDDSVATSDVMSRRNAKALAALEPLRTKSTGPQASVQQRMVQTMPQFGQSSGPPPQTLQSRLLNRAYLNGAEPAAGMLSGFQHQSNVGVRQNFAPVLFAHAWLYTFACLRWIEPLKRLALHKLHQTLLDFTPYPERLVDVVELVRYAYDNGEGRKDNGTVEELRALVTEYVASQVSVFKKDKHFVQLLEEGQEFAVDLVRAVDGDMLR